MNETILERPPCALSKGIAATRAAAADLLGNTAEVEASLPDEPRSESGLYRAPSA